MQCGRVYPAANISLFVQSGKFQGKRGEESHPECILGLQIGLLQVTENFVLQTPRSKVI